MKYLPKFLELETLDKKKRLVKLLLVRRDLPVPCPVGKLKAKEKSICRPLV